jgi:hypothetical protein
MNQGVFPERQRSPVQRLSLGVDVSKQLSIDKMALTA